MALINCKECKELISNEAEACPKCGFKKKKTSGCLVVFLGFIIFSIFIGTQISNKYQEVKDVQQQEETRIASLTSEQKKQEDIANKKRQQKAALKEEEKIVSRNCRNAVKESLHDPSNSEFDDYKHFYFKREKTNRFLVQVTGRAKNGFGALRKITVDCTMLKTDTGNYFVSNLKQIY